MATSELVVDLDAIRRNVALLRASTTAEVMAVVKADGYGHGLVPSARAALSGGASWLGVAQIDEALALRAAGISAPVLAWLWAPDEGDAVEQAVAGGVDVSVSSRWALDTVVARARAAGRSARIHLKIDTGLSRNGVYVRDWPDVIAATLAAVAAGDVEVVGLWSHFAYADAPGHPTIGKQLDAFRAAIELAEDAGLRPQYRHIANSAASLTLPDAHFDMVRPGVAIYGLNPVPDVPAPGLRPAMSLRSHVALAKRVEAGEGVSYGHQYTTAQETTLALVPLGYADGIPRHASDRGPVLVGGHWGQVSGRVCMDQFVVDVGDADVHDGDAVVVFGSGESGEPTAQDWADAVGTIHYEIVTRIGARVPRRYVDSEAKT
jgi:alanine racemase